MRFIEREEQLEIAQLARKRWQKRIKRERNKVKAKLVEVRIVPPADFSFTTNYSETVECLHKLKNATLKKPKKGYKHTVHIDLAPITRISTAAALVLAAEIDRWRRYKRVSLSPRNIEDWDDNVRNILCGLGFFELLGGSSSQYFDEIVEDEISILPLVACNTLDNKRIAEIQDRLWAVASVFEQDPSIYAALIEATYNSIKHAYPKDHDFEYPILGRYWWATGSWSPVKSEIRLLVYDQGVGIAQTLPKWDHWEKVTGWLSSRIPGAGRLLQEHANLIEAALEVSRTSLTSGHGQGLSDVLSPIDVLGDGRVRILSGKGQLSYTTGGAYEKRENGLHIGGTLIEWTIPVPALGQGDTNEDD